MAIDICALEKRYFGACKRQEIPPNKSIVAALFKAKRMKACREITAFIVPIDDLKDVDFYPLLVLLKEIDGSEIDAVDMVNRSSCAMSGEYVSSLLHAVNNKLRLVDICDILFGKDFLLDLAQQGLASQVLNLKPSHFRKLNMVGEFLHMHTLNLDFSASLTIFQEDCFSCMPKLRYLSLCGTRITNLWTTSAAIAKLPSLVELRFQNLYPRDTGYCPTSFGKEVLGSDHTYIGRRIESPSSSDEEMNDYDMVRSRNEDSSDDSEVDFSGHHQYFSLMELLPDVSLDWDVMTDLQNEDFNMSVLAAYIRPSSNSEIVKVNLLARDDHDKSYSYKQQSHSVTGMGG